MTVITLPPEIEAPLAAEAKRRGIAPESLAIESLRELFSPTDGVAEHTEGTLYDRLKDYIGTVHGSGESVAHRTGEVFTDIVAEKHRRGEQ